METLTGVLLTAIFFVILIIIASEKIDKVSITLLGVVVTVIVASITGLIDDIHIVYQ